VDAPSIAGEPASDEQEFTLVERTSDSQGSRDNVTPAALTFVTSRADLAHAPSHGGDARYHTSTT